MKSPKKSLGLYVHVPFCKSKCAYCDFYSVPHAETRMDEYVKALSAHLTETAPRAEQYLVDTVYFGGGTPSFLGERRLSKLLNTIGKYYHVDKQAEITLEANPDTACDWRSLRALRRTGFNRISLGMQSADNAILHSIGRVHTFQQVQDAAEAVRKADIPDLSLDLIYGLPGQTMEIWQKDLQAALSLSPEHLSCYGLKVEEGTPLWRRREQEQFPDDEAQADMYLWTVSHLKTQGYAHYEISNFARPGHASRHNLKYWTLGEYAGFGPGAHSDFGGVRYAYVRDLDAYLRGVLQGGDMVSERETLTSLDRDTEYIMLRLRTSLGLDPKVFENTYRRRFQIFLPTLERCREAGYAQEGEDGRWRLTPTGFLLSNQIIGQLLEDLAADKRRRAAAAARGDFRVENL